MSRIDALRDPEYQESTVERVTEREDGYELHHRGAWVLWCPKVDGIVPKAGDTLRTWGRGIGFTVRGIAINWQIVRYETDAEDRARFKREQSEQNAKQRAEAEANKADTDARYASLPDVFRRRIDRFRAGHADFWWKYQTYELFACEQAVLIAEAMKESDAIPAFAKLEWEQQKQIVPGLSDQHSGNTFGAACRLAHWYLTKPENVVREHGALTVLVGCDEYGCTHGG